MSNRAVPLMGLLCAAAATWCSAAQAQSNTTGAIQGVVKDKGTDEPAIGVTVIATSPSLPGDQRAETDATGFYKITDLPPGRYLVVFYYMDITEKHREVVVSINKTTPLYPFIDTSQGGVTYEFDGYAPLIDPTKTTHGQTLDREFLDKAVVPGRTFDDALGAVAGTAGDDLGVSISGSTSIESQFNVEGINTTGLTYGTVGSPLITDFVEEIEVLTGGYNAEHGRATGGVINVVTKSGSNELHGSVFSYVTPGFLTAARQRTPTEASSIDAEANLAYNFDLGFDLGGPVIRDRVFFYVGLAPRLAQTDVDRITKRQTDCRTTLADGSLSACDPSAHGDGIPDEDPATGFRIYEELDRQRFHFKSASYPFLAKLSMAASPDHQGRISLIGTPSSSRSIGLRGDPTATGYDYVGLTTDLSAKWTSKLDDNHTELEAVLGWHRSAVEMDAIDEAANDVPRQNLYFGDLGTWSRLGFESLATAEGCTDGGNDPYPYIVNCPDNGAGYSIGGPGAIVDETEVRLSGRISATQRLEAAGKHEAKLGLDLEDNRVDHLRHISGGVYYEVYLPPSDVTYATRWVRLAPPDSFEGYEDLCRDSVSDRDYACEYLGRDEVLGRTLNWSGYARDSWQLRPNLTLNYGLRYEEQRLRYAEDLQNTVDPYTGNALGTNAMTIRGMWSPRVGMVYDWTKTGHSKLYGHWGRFYESIPMDINNRSFGGETMFQQIYDASAQCGEYDPAIGGTHGTNCTGTPAMGENLFGSGVLIAPGIRGQFMDEYILGVEYEAADDLRVGLSYQNRRIGRVLEDLSVDNADTYILANPGEFPVEEERALEQRIAETADPDEARRLEAQLEQYRRIRSFDRPRRGYQAVQLTATKRFSRKLFLQGSYTYSRTRGNYPGLFSADNGQVDPNITSQFDLIELLANRDGPLPIDRPHYLKIDGYYTHDFGRAGALTTAARVRALSGSPISALGRHYLYGFDESFLLPRGAMGRSAFDYGLDLRVAFERQLVGGMSLELFADLFSVLDNQGTYSVWQRYSPDPVNPIVGGEYTDLVFAKAQTVSGEETNEPARRDRNFLNPTGRYAPLSARLGARLTF